MDDKLKVTDKRMFTADGELREREPDSDDSADSDRPASQPRESVPRAPAEDRPSTGAEGVDAGMSDSSGGKPLVDAPREPDRSNLGARKGDFPAPTFVDLVGLLAQPIAMFLGDAKLPGGEVEENLPLARFHIDLLELIEAKTKGNISSEEAKLLEDLLYQLRMRYLQKAG